MVRRLGRSHHWLQGRWLRLRVGYSVRILLVRIVVISIIVGIAAIGCVSIVGSISVVGIIRIFLLDVFRIWKFIVLLPFHPPVLEPDFDLPLRKTEGVRYFDASPPSKVPVEVKLFL